MLSEDRAQEVLTRRYLEAVGYDLRKIDFVTAPRGGGSGEQFVRTQYPHEVAAYRQRNPQYWRLVVLIDADVSTVAQRDAELGLMLLAHQLPTRTPGEGIVHLIPRRNIETWVHFLLDNAADEEVDYKRIYHNQAENAYCRPASQTLVAIVRADPVATSLPSLDRGAEELRRSGLR
ncbi:hypothetical protein FRUB_00029 [Fimbriiglobus ruber]|uniref:Uncharacterized protein n=1 Tax=Fimbriiglobus ruber TaxID=1908690 RepID=A0A225DXR0_9BACT|nr:hypothetical protein FRUB_00029 [Fimbriiglobus ruber]